MEWPRQTKLFVAMSGLWGNACLFPARGFPDPASFLAYIHYGRQVVRRDDWDGVFGFPSIPEDEALEAIEAVKSRFLPFLSDFISDPVYEAPSWLTRSEFQQCLVHSKIDDASFDCKLTLSMMESIELRGLSARMVFWFDT